LNYIFALTGFKGILFLAVTILIAVATLLGHRRGRGVLFSFITGSAVAFIMLHFAAMISQGSGGQNPFFIAFAVVLIIFLWKFLFGPWDSRVKAEVLGVFLFWIAAHIMEKNTLRENMATFLAILIALIPAGIWCLLFLRYHSRRISILLLTFFSGMLSTAPILFYDYVVRQGAELHFFLFRITPANFLQSSRTFVAGALTGEPGVITASVVTTLVSFALVGVIEEWSKHWVTRKSDPAYFTSVNDVMQLSIIAGIGFAFAENIVNPNYFISFVTNYLVNPPSPQWGLFLASIFGRSIITNMVHITCSGVLGYFYGLAFFAKPALEEDRAHGRRHRLIVFIHTLTGISRIELYREAMMMQGLLFAILLHSAFDIAVSLPETLPSHPQTIGDLFHIGGPLAGVNLVLLPALVYVFGGFSLLTFLFHRKSDLKEFGYRLRQEVFVRGKPA